MRYLTRCLVSRKRRAKRRSLSPRLKYELVLLEHTLTCLLIRIVVRAGWLLDVQSRFQRSAVLILYLNHQTVIVNIAVWRTSRNQSPESYALPDIQHQLFAIGRQRCHDGVHQSFLRCTFIYIYMRKESVTLCILLIIALTSNLINTYIDAFSATWCNSKRISWFSSHRPRPRRNSRSGKSWDFPAVTYKFAVSPRQRDHRKSGSIGNVCSSKTDPPKHRRPCFEVSGLLYIIKSLHILPNKLNILKETWKINELRSY